MSHYDTLGVDKNANQDEIKKAWKKIAVKHHPDRNPDSKEAEDKFKQAQAAYGILSDPDKRARYDIELLYGAHTPRSYPNNNARARARNWRRVNVTDFNFSSDVFDDFSEVLKATAGARAKHENYRESLRPGSDLDIVVSISLEEAAHGCSKEIRAPSKEKLTCPVCLGKRAVKGARIVCSRCMGSGRRLYFSDQTKCDNCGGTGDIPKYPCDNCLGKGYIISKKNIKVKIPAGIDNDHKLKLAGMGNPGQPSGDLFITIKINEHPIFKRVGQDLYMDHTVPFDVAMKGGLVTVPSINGQRIKVEIPKKIEPGQTIIKIIGAGIKNVSGDTLGNLFVTLQVQLPELKTNRAKKLFEELIDEIFNR